MHRYSHISRCKLLLRCSVQRSSVPTLPSFFNSIERNLTLRVCDSVPFPIPKSPYKTFLNFHSYQQPACVESVNQFLSGLRKYSVASGGSAVEFDQDREVDMINLKFADAREEIEMAMESKETVYFDEEAESARTAVKEVLGMFEGLLAKLPESERAALQRSMGLKIEQLKAELRQLDE